MNDDVKYTLTLKDTDTRKKYFWTGESFSQNKDDALKKPSGNDFQRTEIHEVAKEKFPNCRVFVFNEKNGFVGLSAEFKNGEYVGLM